jgi:predicted ATPase with chaperone activity
MSTRLLAALRRPNSTQIVTITVDGHPAAVIATAELLAASMTVSGMHHEPLNDCSTSIRLTVYALAPSKRSRS